MIYSRLDATPLWVYVVGLGVIWAVATWLPKWLAVRELRRLIHANTKRQTIGARYKQWKVDRDDDRRVAAFRAARTTNQGTPK